ncbi:rCG38692, isoform CRA_d, partial [Rattus norvegicus]
MVCRKARCAWERMLKPSWPGPSPQRQRPQASSQLPAIWSPGRCTCQDSSSPPRPDQDHLPSVFKKIFCQGGLPAPLLHLPQRGLPQPMAWELGHHGASDSLRSHPVQRTRRIQTHPGPLLWLSWRVRPAGSLSIWSCPSLQGPIHPTHPLWALALTHPSSRRD